MHECNDDWLLILITLMRYNQKDTTQLNKQFSSRQHSNWRSLPTAANTEWGKKKAQKKSHSGTENRRRERERESDRAKKREEESKKLYMKGWKNNNCLLVLNINHILCVCAAQYVYSEHINEAYSTPMIEAIERWQCIWHSTKRKYSKFGMHRGELSHRTNISGIRNHCRAT